MECNNSNVSAFSKVGIFSISLLVTVFAVYVYSPVIKSHAVGVDPVVDVNLHVPAQLNMHVDESGARRMKTDSSSFANGSASIYVTTNSQYGYSLMLEDSDNDASMKNYSASGADDRITSSFSGTKTSDTMDANTWGYSLDSTNYNSVPTFGNPVRIRNISGIVDDESKALTNLGFGVKVGRTTKSGYYADVVIVTSVVNGQDGNYAPRTMQDFVCVNPRKDHIYDPTYGDPSSYVSNQVYNLVDERDGKTYRVVAAADGGCWMIDNLDITDYAANSNDTEFGGRLSTYQIPDSLNTWNFSYDDGEVYETGVQGYGAYYNYHAAMAGTISGDNNYTEYYERVASICPSGWEMPSYYSWQYLFDEYGLSLMSGISAEDLANLPINLNLNKAGANTVEDGVNGQGEVGIWWTNRTPWNNTNYRTDRAVIVLDSNGLRLDHGNRRNGYSIRCVKRGYNPSSPSREEEGSDDDSPSIVI